MEVVDSVYEDTSWLEEDVDCPLCMEELDVTDKMFKPCECGYQVRIHAVMHSQYESVHLIISS
jgi:hypothetical protein